MIKSLFKLVMFCNCNLRRKKSSGARSGAVVGHLLSSANPSNHENVQLIKYARMHHPVGSWADLVSLRYFSH